MMADRLARNLKEEYLSCRICLDLFLDPRKLPCDHVFCRECLTKHARQTHVTRHFRNFITCPLCRDEIEVHSNRDFVVQEWVEGLPKDTLLLSLIQTLEKHTKEQQNSPKNPKNFSCQAHDLKQREAYCMTHAQLICWECASRDHSSCVVDSAKEALVKIEPKLDALKQAVREQISKAQVFSKHDQEFDEGKIKTLKDIEEFKTRLTTVYESAMQQTDIAKDDVRRMNSKHLEGRKEFYKTVTTLFELEAALQDAEPSEILDVFVQMNKEVETAQKELDGLTSQAQRSEVVFRKDEKVTDFLKSFSSIGFVDVVHGPAREGDSVSSLTLAGSNTIVASTPSSIAHILQRENPRMPNDMNATATSCEEEDVTDSRQITHQRLENDFSALVDKEDECFVNGILTNPENEDVFYAIDRVNEKIKKFNINGVLVDFIDLSGPPHDGTFLVQNGEICVTQPDEHLLTFVKGEDLVLKRYASTAVPYNGICRGSPDSLVVSSWSAYCVDIVNLHGHVLRHFSREELSCNLPNVLCALPGGNVAMTEVGKVITCVCPDTRHAHGKLYQWQYSAPERVYGVCADRNGVIYACVKERNEIRSINADGFLQNGAYLSETDGLLRPIAVGILRQFVIVAEEGGRIRVFRMTTDK